MWALRDCVVAQRATTMNAREALDFYRRMADESTQLAMRASCRPTRNAAVLCRIWSRPDRRDCADHPHSLLISPVSFRSFSVFTPTSIGDHDNHRRTSDLTRDDISSSVQYFRHAPAQPGRDSTG